MASKHGALHEMFEREGLVEGPSDRRFGITFAIVSSAIAALSFWRHGTHAYYWLTAAALFAILAFLWPATLRPLNKAWLRFGLLLHAIVSPIVMGVMFFLVFAPMGFLLRRLGKDLLRLRSDPAARSYWIIRSPPGPAPDSLKRQF